MPAPGWKVILVYIHPMFKLSKFMAGGIQPLASENWPALWDVDEYHNMGAE